MIKQRQSYPLRLDNELKKRVEGLAKIQDRSLNWQLNELVKIGLQITESENGKTLISAGKH